MRWLPRRLYETTDIRSTRLRDLRGHCALTSQGLDSQPLDNRPHFQMRTAVADGDWTKQVDSNPGLTNHAPVKWEENMLDVWNTFQQHTGSHAIRRR